MTTTVTLNPCLDRTVTVENLRIEATNRVLSTREDVSGKGINVSIALKQLGCATHCVGVDFDDRGLAVQPYLSSLSIPWDYVAVHGKPRTNIKIFDQQQRAMTELNEPGRPLPAASIRQVFEKIVAAAAQSGILVLSGSVPQGVPAGIYRDIIGAVPPKTKVIVDAYGALLDKALCPGVTLVKPNLMELEHTLGVQVRSMAGLVAAAEAIHARGVRYVCVSLGRHGAVLSGPDARVYAPAPGVVVQGVQGAGDSMVAGLCAAMEEGLPAREMLRYAMAVCGGSLLREGTQMCTRDDFHALLPQTSVVDLREAPDIPFEEESVPCPS